ncbi:hypothetical protein [Flavobacterium sp.]|jgi:hypothetical protein|uniref:hypothetical protein n=1 Tax=Flavobacterium sp. TaxID=239 RepID=UPI0037BF6D90
MRFRQIFIGIGSLLVLLLVFLSDPTSGFISKLPVGSGALGLLIGIVISILYVALLHVSRKGLLDYLDLETLFSKAVESSQGAGLALVGVGLIMISISIVIHAAAK